MSALFFSYEQELSALVASLKARASNIDERFSEDLREAEALVTQLEIEARASSASNETKARVNNLREDIRTLRDRSTLLGGAKSNHPSRPVRFTEDDEALDRSAQTLLDSRRTLMETESLAAGINEDLLSHRSTILSTREKLLHTGGLLGRAHRTMRVMQNRDVQRKLCVYAAVAFVLLMFLAFAIQTLFPASKANSSTPVPTSSQPTYSPTAAPIAPS